MTIHEAQKALWNIVKNHKYAIDCRVTVGKKETYITIYTLGNAHFQTSFEGYTVKTRKVRNTREILK